MLITPDKFFSEEETQTILRALKDAKDLALHRGRFYSHIRDWGMIGTFALTGLRNAELAVLKVSDLHEDKLHVRSGKGGKERVVLLTREAQQHLLEYIRLKRKVLGESVTPDSYLFLNERGTFYCTEGIRKRCRLWISKCGFEAYRRPAHKFRHTNATLLLRNGVDLPTVRDNLGHASLATTNTYSHAVKSIENVQLLGALKNCWASRGKLNTQKKVTNG